MKRKVKCDIFLRGAIVYVDIDKDWEVIEFDELEEIWELEEIEIKHIIK